MNKFQLFHTCACDLLHRVKHDTDDRYVWVYFDCSGEKYRWLLTDEEPIEVGRKHSDAHPHLVCGRLYVEVRVKEVFTKVEDLLQAERSNGFNSWKPSSAMVMRWVDLAMTEAYGESIYGAGYSWLRQAIAVKAWTSVEVKDMLIDANFHSAADLL